MPQNKKNPLSSRVRPHEIEDAVYRPNVNVHGDSIDHNIGQAIDRDTQCFCLFGKHEALDGQGYPILLDDEEDLAEDKQDVLAKIVVVNENTPKYMIRTDSNGRFFNPLGMDEGNHNKFIHRAGKDLYQFKSVNKRAFRFYLDFLRTKNTAHHRNAERESF